MTELFEGAIRFNGWFLAINGLMLLLFLYQWRQSYLKTGVNLDIWNYNMFLIFALPFIVMYPFASSNFNILSVDSKNLAIISDAMQRAYLVTLLGFLSVFLGKFCYERFGINAVINSFFYLPFRHTIGHYYERIVLNRRVSQGFVMAYTLILALFVSFTISQGFASNPRAFFMANPAVRPLYNLTISLYGIAFGILSTRILHANQRLDKLLLLPIIGFGFFLGVRAPLIFQGLGFGVLYIIYRKRGYFPLYKMGLALVAILVVVVGLVLIRNSGEASSVERNATAIFLYEIFYGNTFSDIRDFSWVLGYWDGSHLWGLSYLSAFLSFIPSAFLPFRETWGIGRVTVNLVGFDPLIHPGLRPGFFGEMYLNFDVIGVVLFGFVWAQVTQKVSTLVRKSAVRGDVIAGAGALTATSFVSYLSNSAGFFGFYVNFIVLAILYVLTRIRISR